MSSLEFISNAVPPSSAENFPEEWYRQTSTDHFWVQWRFEVFLRQLRALGLDDKKHWHGLDIGCGHGVVQGQIENTLGWEVDGCDLNVSALRANTGRIGRVMVYDILEQRAEFREAYDFLLLFDVVEHIEDCAGFMRAALHHLRPGGFVFINVPALMSLYSVYDRVAGHCRRYDKIMMQALFQETGLETSDLRYWGLTMVPVLGVRKALLRNKTNPTEIIRRGFRPPGRLAHGILKLLKQLESGLIASAPVGTSLMAAARKPESGRR